MKNKYRVLEKEFSDGSTWFYPQVGNWWNGWMYISVRHQCPDMDRYRLVFSTFEEADSYMKRLIEYDKTGETKTKHNYVLCTNTKIHNYQVG